ncbi:methylamine utilization protein [Rugamonas apoptosis]|uniref:Methylamine utilization protein n=1 Tax=Rugamonas apoptosis TaxID=2758570 RepID=A0A7W2F9U2_9BURK|nr:methylamine utilization protein [Rugamonas apoptosis]MBA5687689.1 methylamine utilization protein [Rugamonas apoptosis]
MSLKFVLSSAVLALGALGALGAVNAEAAALMVKILDANGAALADTVVYAEPEGGQVPKTMAPGEIAQKGLKFIPLVTVVQTGSKIYFPNNDRVRHHIYSFSPAHKFDQKLYSGEQAPPQLFDKAGTVVLGCNIHDKMLAFVKVVDTPYFAKSDAGGLVQLDLPAGKYTVKAWHYDAAGGLTPEQPAQVKAGEGGAPLVFRLTLKQGSADPDAAARPNL